MGIQVCNGALCQCSFGAAPSSLTVLPANQVFSDQEQPAATIQDFAPFVNVSPFGVCSSPNHPMMQSLGVPGPCIPAPTGPWTPGSSQVFIQNIPALSSEHTLSCGLGGTITVAFPGQTTVIVS